MNYAIDLECTPSFMVEDMETELSIQQVAAITHLSAHTLRYYERIGLLSQVERASSGHRCYSSQDIDWINFLMRLRATAMPIRDMRRFAELRRQGDRTISQRRQLLETQQQHIQQQLDELTLNLKVIQEKIQHYSELERSHDTISITKRSNR
jgi:DNA-binding transcriptional MerR regulator